MSRSVNYLNNAEVVLYFPFEYSDNSEDNILNWNDLEDNLKYEIKAKLPSYYISDKWDNSETKIILENNLCCIGISEYYGLVSLSVAPKNNEYDVWYEQFSKHHALQIKKTLEKCIDYVSLNRLHKIGTFSNGEAVFKKV